MTGALHTAGINAIEVIVSSDKLIKMVNFKLAHEMWRSINQNYLSDAIVIQEAEIEISSAISLLYAVSSPQCSRELTLRF